MEKVKIIIDSSSDLTLDEIEKYNLEVIPLTINIDGEEYDYKTIGNEEYIIRMRTAKEFSTSQPAIGKYIEAFEKWTREGYKILVLTISSALSGTYNSVLAASSDFNNIYVVDTKTTTRGMVYLLESAIEQINNNISLDVVADNLREQAKKIYTFVTIDNLDNLVKGGRLSKASALIGNLLNIKVLTQLKETELIAIDKVRGKKKLVHSLIDHMRDVIGDREIKKISLPHAISDGYIKLIRHEIQDNFNYYVEDKDIFVTTPIISTHTGENAVGILIELA